MTTEAKISPVQGLMANAPALLARNGMNINALRTNTLLRKEEWEELDMAVVDVARGMLNAVMDLRNQGLVHPLGGLGTLISQYEQQSDMGDADIDMDGVTRGNEDTVDWTPVDVPVPIIHKDFRVSIRRLDASRRLGDGLDVTGAAVAARKVSEGLENLVFNGNTRKVGGAQIYGYTSHPDRNTGSLTAAWTAASGTDIIGDVLAMIGKAVAANYFGPYMLYVPQTYWSALLEDYKANTERTYLERIRAIDGIIDVKPSYKLATNNVVLVQMTRDVVDLATALDITTVEWDVQGGMLTNFKVMAALAPRVKSDDNNASGVVHYSV